MSAESSVLESLSQLSLLKGLSTEQLRELAANASQRRFDLGETIVTAGTPGEGLYLIRRGGVRLLAERNGKHICTATYGAGETFAEPGALTEYRHEYSVRASGKTEIILVPRVALADVLSASSEMTQRIAQLAAQRMAASQLGQWIGTHTRDQRTQLEALSRQIGIKRIAVGQPLVKQGDRDDGRWYLIRQGHFDIVREHEGRRFWVDQRASNDAIGISSAQLKKGHPVSAIATTDSLVLVLPLPTVGELSALCPNLVTDFDTDAERWEREQRRQLLDEERDKRKLRFDLRSQPALGERIVTRFPMIEQADSTDCGAACLAMISQHHGHRISLGKLRELANVGRDGATLASLAKASESLGFVARAMQCTYTDMLSLELPLIAHWEGYHWIVVYGVSKQHVWIADPAMGHRKISVEAFEKGWTGACLTLEPGVVQHRVESSPSPWRRFLRLLQPHKTTLAYLLLATLVIEGLGIAPPIIVQNVLDRVLVHQSESLLLVLIAAYVLATVFTQVTSVLRSLLANFMVRKLDFAMMSHFFRHTMSLSLSFFNKRRTGDIFARFQENQTIRAFLTQSTVSTILNLLMMFLYLIVLFIYSVKMTLLMLIMIVPLAVLTLLITPRIKDFARRNFTASTESEAILMETLSSTETIKAMGIERTMRMRWEKRYANALNVQYQAQRFDAIVSLIGALMQSAITITLLWVGANLVMAQELTVGQLIAFNMLLGGVMAPIMGLIGLWDELLEAGVAMERLGDVLDIEPEQKPDTLASRIVLPQAHGEIHFENVYFRYGNDDPPVLENINLAIKPGETLALVGPSGSGKSTLAKMLVGFFPPDQGRILIDGYDLEHIHKTALRTQIGYVMQSNLLFSGSIAENITIGEEYVDHRRMIEVAKLADAHSFISRLPLGYEQEVGERGVGLSGGQIQRLCIARALYHDPKLLILDEATSALDTQSEASILSNLNAILADRTAVVIAHRMSTIMNADRIAVLYRGAIAELGTHDELLSRRGMYYELVQRQLAA